jgi:hypothetical protein
MTHPVSAVPSASRDGIAAARHLARWLGLAATPTFAIMAVLTAVLGGGPADMLCAAGHESLLGGMVPMYLLMSAFHSAAWLRLISGGPIGAVSHRARLVLRDAAGAAPQDEAQLLSCGPHAPILILRSPPQAGVSKDDEIRASLAHAARKNRRA